MEKYKWLVIRKGCNNIWQRKVLVIRKGINDMWWGNVSIICDKERYKWSTIRKGIYYYYKDLFTHKDINTYINGVV